jgi:hypothetical protein
VFTLPGLQAGTEVRQEGNQDLMPGGIRGQDGTSTT